jgi:RNA polymerase sigma-70 factor (ECF subfamily)
MYTQIQPNSPALEAAAADLDLVHATKNGDVAAFEELVKRYDRKLLRIAQNVTHNREDAEDAVQEAFLQAFQHLGQFRENSRFSTWLIRITLNQSLTKLRKRRPLRDVSLDYGFPSDHEDHLPIDVEDWAPNPEELYRASELRTILRKTLRGLSASLRVVFVLRDIEGLSLEETADALGLSVTAVKARSLRARLQLRERLSRYFKKADSCGEGKPRFQHADSSEVGDFNPSEGKLRALMMHFPRLPAVSVQRYGTAPAVTFALQSSAGRQPGKSRCAVGRSAEKRQRRDNPRRR